jgi:hypothetical protein
MSPSAAKLGTQVNMLKLLQLLQMIECIPPFPAGQFDVAQAQGGDTIGQRINQYGDLAQRDFEAGE